MALKHETRCYEHRDIVATAMCVDRSGDWVLLAGRRHFALQHLGDEGLLKFARNSKYEISAAEFNICGENRLCAIATSENIDLVDWSEEPRIINTLKGHTRVITDIDWHSKDPFLLSSCSIDTFTHVWDLREPRRPALSLSAVCMSGATQVGFNRITGNLLAAAHDGDLRIWDLRMASCPTHYITAHQNRVHGINWSHRRQTCLATASQDGTVKYFDINNPRRAEKIITTSSPVWRARYTPIGNGLVTIVVAHLGRGENSLLLWSNSKQTDPICSFVGHTDVILDFAWRPNRENQSEIELVTWSRDRTLRLWKIDETLFKLCEPSEDYTCDDLSPVEIAASAIDSHGCDDAHEHHQQQSQQQQQQQQSSQQLRMPHVAVLEALGGNPSNSVPIALDTLQISRSPPPHARSLTDQPTCALHHEFSLFNMNIPHVEVDLLDAFKRFALFKVSAAGHLVVLQASFPTEYPVRVSPEFSFCPGTTLLEDHRLAKLLLKTLRQNAMQRVKHSRTCLEQCLRALVAHLKKSGGGGNSEKSQIRLQSPRLEGALSGALHDACIPFPRTSSAVFNGIGMLVTVVQPYTSKRLTLRRSQNTTPRTFSALNGLLGPQPVLYSHRSTSSSFYSYLQDRIPRQYKNRSLQHKSVGGSGGSGGASAGRVLLHIYDASKLLNINREIAANFTLDKRNLMSTCHHNRQVCESNGRPDLVSVWMLAELIATPNHSDETWNSPTYDAHKKRLLTSLIKHYATAGDLQTAVMLACAFEKSSPPQSPMNYTIAASANSDSSHDSTVSSITHFEPVVKSGSDTFCDYLKLAYGDILYGWQLLTKRALILKHNSLHSQCLSDANEFWTASRHGNERSLSKTKHIAVLLCALCCQPVKGSANICLSCGHGGHTVHMLQWFKKHDVCASGCGCSCLQLIE